MLVFSAYQFWVFAAKGFVGVKRESRTFCFGT